MRLSAIIFTFSASIIVASSCHARDIAPATPPEPVILGQVIDRQMPAFIPKFISQRTPPAGLAEREWAIRNTYPSFGYFGGGFAYGGWGFGSCGVSCWGGGSMLGASLEQSDSLP